jgi:putative transposase
MDAKRSTHAVYNLNYHFVWTPKYRYSFLDLVENTVESGIRDSIRDTAIEIQSLHIASDHVHLFVSVPPTEAPCDVVRRIKSISARRLWSDHGLLMEELYWGGGCWERSYYVGTADTVSATTIR